MAAAALAVLLAGCGARLRAHHPEGPPVSADALRASIEHTGLEIEWHDGRPGGKVIADLAGEARDPKTGGRVAFELALTKGHADEEALGRSRYPLKYDPESGSPIIVHFDEPDEIDPVPRGTIRNVAYANWFYGADDEYASEQVSARLDQAIMDAFPPGDAEAHPILSSPPE
jgi:hypothetical protein